MWLYFSTLSNESDISVGKFLSSIPLFNTFIQSSFIVYAFLIYPFRYIYILLLLYITHDGMLWFGNGQFIFEKCQMLEEYFQLKIVDSSSCEYLTKTYLILNLLMWVVCIKKRFASVILLFYIFKKLNLELSMWKNS